MGLDASQLLPGQQPFPDTKPEYTGPVPLAPTYPAAPLSEVNERLSRPPYLTGYAGVLTIVPRRGWDAKTNLFLSDIASNPVKALSQWSMSQPLRLLYSLADIHPLVGAARSVWLSMSFGQDDTRFIAVDDKGDENEDVSKLLVDLMEHQDVSIGGLVGLQNAIGEQALFNGLATVEYVPDTQQIYTFDPLTIRFRDDGTGNRYCEQIQRTGWRYLNPLTCLAIPFDGNFENPYGRAKFAPALGEALADIARNTNLNDVIKSVAWPRLTVGFPYQEILQYAEEHPEVLIARAPDGGDLTPAQYAMAEFQRVGEKMLTLKADDVFIYPVGGTVESINGANGIGQIIGAFEHTRHRLCMALDTLPTLLGVTSGGTLAYSTVDWAMQVRKIEGFRSFVNNVICKLFNVHLRTLGLPYTVKAECEPIRASDAYADEQTRQLKIANEQSLVDAGYQDRTAASLNLIGQSPAVDDATHEANQQAKAQQQLEMAQAQKAPAPGQGKTPSQSGKEK